MATSPIPFGAQRTSPGMEQNMKERKKEEKNQVVDISENVDIS
jgi:hypothetical protein